MSKGVTLSGDVSWSRDEHGTMRAEHGVCRASVWFDEHGDIDPDEEDAPGFRFLVEVVRDGEESICVTHGIVHCDDSKAPEHLRDTTRRSAVRVACSQCTAAMAVFSACLGELAVAHAKHVQRNRGGEGGSSPLVH